MYDANIESKRLFIKYQHLPINSFNLRRAICNVCNAIKEIYDRSLDHFPKEKVAEQEVFIFSVIKTYKEKRFQKFLDINSKPEDIEDLDSNKKLMNDIAYLYKVVHGTLSVEALVGHEQAKDVKNEENKTIIGSLKGIFNDHLERLTLDAKRKIEDKRKKDKVKELTEELLSRIEARYKKKKPEIGSNVVQSI